MHALTDCVRNFCKIQPVKLDTNNRFEIQVSPKRFIAQK